MEKVKEKERKLETAGRHGNRGPERFDPACGPIGTAENSIFLSTCKIVGYTNNNNNNWPMLCARKERKGNGIAWRINANGSAPLIERMSV